MKIFLYQLLMLTLVLAASVGAIPLTEVSREQRVLPHRSKRHANRNHEIIDVARGPILDKQGPSLNQDLLQDSPSLRNLFTLVTASTNTDARTVFPNSDHEQAPTPAPRPLLPPAFACRPRNVTRTIRYGAGGCIGTATFGVCDGFCRSTTRAKKVFPFNETRHKACQVTLATTVLVPLNCSKDKRNLSISPHGSQPTAVPVLHALACGCKTCEASSLA